MARRQAEQRRRTARRGAPTRAPKARFLVVCEGEKTEPLYFRSLRDERGLLPVEVEVLGPETGTDPRNLVDNAASRQRRARRGDDPYDQVWCVFDRDQHDHIPEATDRARQLGIEVAFSSPCFELWYLLHFRYSTAHIERDKAARELNGLVEGGYEKYRPDVYALLLDSQPTAITNAQCLRAHHDAVNDGRPENPWTNVDQLVTTLNALADSP
ncbi:MAG: RloB domain-containing protein [Armatimonadetes bacterium]|nr:RloB domain-containing protein [Armatimonadota bacterium]